MKVKLDEKSFVTYLPRRHFTFMRGWSLKYIPVGILEAETVSIKFKRSAKAQISAMRFMWFPIIVYDYSDALLIDSES